MDNYSLSFPFPPCHECAVELLGFRTRDFPFLGDYSRDLITVPGDRSDPEAGRFLLKATIKKEVRRIPINHDHVELVISLADQQEDFHLTAVKQVCSSCGMVAIKMIHVPANNGWERTGVAFHPIDDFAGSTVPLRERGFIKHPHFNRLTLLAL